MSDELWYPYRIRIPDQAELEDSYRELLDDGYNVVAISSSSDRMYYLYVINDDEIDGIARILEDNDIEHEIQEWDMEPE